MILEEDQRRKGRLGNTGCFYEGCELSPPQQADPLRPAGYTARVTPALTKMPAPRGRLPTRHPAPPPHGRDSERPALLGVLPQSSGGVLGSLTRSLINW